MDLRRDFLFPVIIWIVIQRDFILGGQAGFHGGSLILDSNEKLTIDTTAPSIVKENCDSCSYKASHGTRNSPCVANVVFSGDIEFKRGSSINITGKCALSITSQHGNITIKTDINMTCDKDVLNTTCLGGFTQSKITQKAGTLKENFYTGCGRGGLQVKEYSEGDGINCLPGSGHGGKISYPDKQKDVLLDFAVGEAYGQEDLTTVEGGSGGSCIGSPKGVAGGGAIELVSETGSITIDASIRASAQRPRSDARCSGGSGGLIRLKAQQVEILSNGALVVDGGDGIENNSGRRTRFGGGAGGVIQIISAMGNLPAHSLSLRRGHSSKQGCENKGNEANGYYYLQACKVTGHDETFPGQVVYWNTKPNLTNTCNVTGHNETFPGQDFYWNTKPHLTNTMTTSPTSSSQQTTTSSSKGIDERVNKLLNHSKHLWISLEKNGEWNKSEFREVISVHKNLTSSFSLSQKTVRRLCLEMFNIYRAIMDDIAERDPEFLKEALQGILEIASNCTGEKNHLIWKENRRLPELMQTLEDTLVSSLQGNSSTEVNRVIVSSNAVAQVVRESSTASMTDITIPNISVVEGDSWKSVVDFLVIPRLTVMKAKGNYTYVFVLFKDVANALPSNTAKKRERIPSADWEVSSLLMSCFLMLDDVPVKDLKPPAILTFNTSVAQTLDKQCSFWDANKSYWSAEGIKQISSVDSELTVCETNHFTSFAVLIKYRATELSGGDKLALSIITYVGCGVSTVALSITLIVFLSIETLSADRHKIHMNLVLSLLFAQVLFLAGIGETSNQVICKIIAVFMHYLYLTAFTWMLVEGLHLYLKVVQVFKTENVKILYYYIFGWGFAIIPVGITTALKPNKYGNSDICWLSLEDGTVWAFIGPVIAIIAVNGIVLLMVIKTVVTSAASIKSSEYDHIKAGIKGLFVLMPILGVGWILGLFAVNKATIVFEYAFAIVNGLQGLFIFLLHCAFNNEVRNAFRRRREKNALSKENDSQYQPTFSLSHSIESGDKEKRFSFNSQEKIKAPLSFKKKTTTRVVQVEPMRDRPDISDTALKVNRTFETGHSNKLAVTDEESEISSLHCPSLEDEERAPPKTSHLVNQRTTSKKK